MVRIVRALTLLVHDDLIFPRILMYCFLMFVSRLDSFDVSLIKMIKLEQAL